MRSLEKKNWIRYVFLTLGLIACLFLLMTPEMVKASEPAVTEPPTITANVTINGEEGCKVNNEDSLYDIPYTVTSACTVSLEVDHSLYDSYNQYITYQIYRDSEFICEHTGYTEITINNGDTYNYTITYDVKDRFTSNTPLSLNISQSITQADNVYVLSVDSHFEQNTFWYRIPDSTHNYFGDLGLYPVNNDCPNQLVGTVPAEPTTVTQQIEVISTGEHLNTATAIVIEIVDPNTPSASPSTVPSTIPNTESNTPSVSPCTHTSTSEWVGDCNGHYQLCNSCDAKINSSEHTWGAEATNTQSQVCTVCGYVKTPALGSSYPVLDGNNGSAVIESNDDYSVRVDCELSKFQSIQIDGNEVSDTNYDVS